ncbi:hydrogenase maturation protease [Embleya scabrispora]|uniref:hydrogenase maturation protease n=1 Tax=Embleya scabrispora TaxID=159449 RepID=UPI0003720261|nr:hydrogenase maturation protease [Embleya scabrispora]MYS87938.1 hydrogenase maturation protease [Streptomyces sp. SID5474]
MTGRDEPTDGVERVLVAGVGNIFLGDDGFGVETVGRIAAHQLPAGAEVVDFGVRGVHLAYQLLEGYDTLILVDATARGGEPGTVYLIEAAVPGSVEAGSALLDGHRMGPDAVLALLGTLSAGTGGTPPRRVLVVGCEPADLNERVGLSPPVAAAVDEAVALILRVLRHREPAERKADRPAGQAAERAVEPTVRARAGTPDAPDPVDARPAAVDAVRGCDSDSGEVPVCEGS